MFCSSKGSVIVNYELAVNKAKTTDTLNTILDTIKSATHNGSFGNFDIDPSFTKASGELYFVFFIHLSQWSLHMLVILVHPVNPIFNKVTIFTR